MDFSTNGKDPDRNELDIDRKQKANGIPQLINKRDPKVRATDWEEVKVGFTAEEAILEATRCIQCPDPAPCMQGCPLGNNIPLGLWHIENGDFVAAANVWRRTTNMPEMCSRLCPQDILCEGSCTMGNPSEPIAIGLLERFIMDYQHKVEGAPVPTVAPPTGKHVAVVGSGPAGLVAAEKLVTWGHRVTVYEAWPLPGGLLLYGIPSFKLEKWQVDRKIKFLEDLGVKFICNTRVGEDVTVDELLAGDVDAVFLAIGAGVHATMRAPGVDLKGIYRSTDYLVRGNLDLELLPEEMRKRPQVGQRVAVIGGGYTATDCIRTSVRLGAESVKMYYRRTEAEMPGSMSELSLGLHEGAEVVYLTAPTAFHDDDGDGRVDAMTLIHMELGEPDDSGRRRPVPIEGSEEKIPIDCVVLAIGYWPDEIIGKTTENLDTHEYGLITVDDEKTGRSTSRPEIFAGGDAIHGPDLVVTAAANGRDTARSIHEFLMGEPVEEKSDSGGQIPEPA